jgi:hypothetical protein
MSAHTIGQSALGTLLRSETTRGAQSSFIASSATEEYYHYEEATPPIRPRHYLSASGFMRGAENAEKETGFNDQRSSRRWDERDE